MRPLRQPVGNGSPSSEELELCSRTKLNGRLRVPIAVIYRRPQALGVSMTWHDPISRGDVEDKKSLSLARALHSLASMDGVLDVHGAVLIAADLRHGSEEQTRIMKTAIGCVRVCA